MYRSLFSSVTLVVGSQSLFAIVASLLRLRVLNSSASSLFPLPFPISFRVFLFCFRPLGHYSLRPSVSNVNARVNSFVSSLISNNITFLFFQRGIPSASHFRLELKSTLVFRLLHLRLAPLSLKEVTEQRPGIIKTLRHRPISTCSLCAEPKTFCTSGPADS
jgi:hypothetical protein